MAEDQQVGLRERKKERTRQQIADAAMRLFLARGFDAVTVVEIAQAADVAEKTVYNYFPTKEDLVYGRLESFETALLTAVRERKPGESVLAAFSRFLFSITGLLARPEATAQLRTVNRMITDSPALLLREQQVFARHTASLATLLAADTGARDGDVLPWVVANALMGVHRAVVDLVRRRSLAGASNATIARATRAQVRTALAALEHGFGDYGVRPG